MKLDITKIIVFTEELHFNTNREVVVVPIDLHTMRGIFKTNLEYTGLRNKFESHDLPFSIKERMEIVEHIMSSIEYKEKTGIIEHFIKEHKKQKEPFDVELIKCYLDGLDFPAITIRIGDEEGEVYFNKNGEGKVVPFYLSSGISKTYLGFTHRAVDIIKEKAKLFMLMSE